MTALWCSDCDVPWLSDGGVAGVVVVVVCHTVLCCGECEQAVSGQHLQQPSGQTGLEGALLKAPLLCDVHINADRGCEGRHGFAQVPHDVVDP